MNAHVPSIPKRLAVTPTMIDDFIIDPVMGAKVIMGITLDAFQMDFLRTCWWVPNVLNCAGFGVGKSFIAQWVYHQLRAMIIPGQEIIMCYQTFETGKLVYWPNFDRIHSPIFDAQKGRMDYQGKKDGKDNSEGPACWHQYYKNGSHILMPAPNWLQDAKSMAGLTVHVAGVDEYTKVESMGKKNAAGQVTDTHGGINQQLLGRLRGGNFNQFHPLWSNRICFTATAESPQHPSWRRFANFQREIRAGNPHYAIVSACYKDFSNLPSYRDGDHDLRPFKEAVPDWETINRMKREFTKSHALRELYGIWARDTTGWYAESALQRCVELGVHLGTKVESTRQK